MFRYTVDNKMKDYSEIVTDTDLRHTIYISAFNDTSNQRHAESFLVVCLYIITWKKVLLRQVKMKVKQ